jgi:hypothetical protein
MTLCIVPSQGAHTLANVVGSYEASTVNAVRVRNWAQRFGLGAAQREQFLEGLAYMYHVGQAYVTHDQMVWFAHSRAQAVLDLRKRGKRGKRVVCFGRDLAGSTADIAQLMDEYVHSQGEDPLLWYESGAEFTRESQALFVDDVNCTGYSFLKAMRAAKVCVPVYGSFYARYTWKREYAEKLYDREGFNVVMNRGVQQDASRMLRPYGSSVLRNNPQIASLRDKTRFSSLQWRHSEVDKGMFFSTSQRALVESQLLLEGVRMREEGAVSAPPMGHYPYLNLGFGCSTVTYRNIPNTCPLALWQARDSYPALFERIPSGGRTT